MNRLLYPINVTRKESTQGAVPEQMIPEKRLLQDRGRQVAPH